LCIQHIDTLNYKWTKS